MTPQKIFDECMNFYRTCDSYSDSGSSYCLGALVEFRTEFVRNESFFFGCYPRDLSGVPKEQSIEWNRKQARINFLGTKLEMESIEEAIVNYSPTFGGAHTIPNLLFACKGGTTVSSASNLKLINSEFINKGAECYVLQASVFKPNDSKVWINKNDFSIERLTKLGVAVKPSQWLNLLKSEIMVSLTGNWTFLAKPEVWIDSRLRVCNYQKVQAHLPSY